MLDSLGDKNDLVLVEGFKESRIPKIEVHRKELGSLVTMPGNLFGVVTCVYSGVSVPQFFKHDYMALVKLLEKRSAVPSWAGTVFPDA